MATLEPTIVVDVRGMPELMREIKRMVVDALLEEADKQPDAREALRRVAERVDAALSATADGIEKAKAAQP